MTIIRGTLNPFSNILDGGVLRKWLKTYPLNIFPKNFIIDAWWVTKYAFNLSLEE